MSTVTQPLSLEEFLKLPETQPASEFVNRKIIQKPMPQGEHSLIQAELCQTINSVAKPQKIAIAFPELRCTFGGASVVPDIAVFRWERIGRESSGRIANRFETYPDWAIEILSPDQRQTKVLENLLHCSEYGTELGWLIDPQDESILAIFPNQRVQLFRGTTQLPIINEINLKLGAEEIFAWLTLS